MTAVPTPTPVTTPLDEPTVAIPVLPLLQVPPAVASERVTDKPKHMVVVPVIPEGVGFKNSSRPGEVLLNPL